MDNMLGSECRDLVVPDFTGIIIQEAYHVSGCRCYLVASQKLVDGKRQASCWLSSDRVEIISDGIRTNLEEKGLKLEKTRVDDVLELGKMGTDKLSSYSGGILAKIFNLFGSDQLALQSKAKDGELKEAESFDIGRISISDEGISVGDIQAQKPGATRLKISDNRAF